MKEGPLGITEQKRATPVRVIKCVLNAGSGRRSSRQLHPVFDPEHWAEARVDIDPAAEADFVGSFADMKAAFSAASFDAVWCSHSLEHIHRHEVPAALCEFRRVLKPDGFVLIRCPDLEMVASLLLQHGVDHVAYVSPIGPITPLDMLFGHGGSIARGVTAMAHKTAFTAESLAQHLLDAGFPIALTKSEYYDLWALGLMADADHPRVQQELAVAGIDFRNGSEEP